MLSLRSSLPVPVIDSVGIRLTPVLVPLGAIFTVPLCAAPVEQVLAWLRVRGSRIFAARVDGAIDYTAVDFRGPAAIVLGSEAAGLSQAWQGDDIVAVRLPASRIPFTSESSAILNTSTFGNLSLHSCANTGTSVADV